MISEHGLISRAFRHFSSDPTVLSERLLEKCAQEYWEDENKYCAAIQKLIQQGANINAQDEKGRTPLSHLAEHQRFKAAGIAIKAGADANIKDCGWGTPLVYAAYRCDLKMMTLLLDNKAELHPTALQGVMANPQPFFGTELDCFKLLLARGMTLQPHEERKIYAERKHLIPGAPIALNARQLGEACESSQKLRLGALLKDGVHPDLPVKFGEKSPLVHYAAVNDVAGMQMLMDAGADVNLFSRKDEKMPLLAAVQQGSVEAVELLLAQGATTDRTKLGFSVFGLVPANQPQQMTQGEFHARQAKCLRLVVDNGLALTQDDKNEIYRDKRFLSAFPEVAAVREMGDAAGKKDWVAVQKLIAAGVHPDSPAAYQGQTPLLYAARQGNLEMIDALLAAGADPDLKCSPSSAFNFAATPLQAALYEDRESAALKLMDAGANPLLPIDDGQDRPVSLVNFYDRAMMKLVNDELVTRAPVLQKKMSVRKPLTFRQKG